MSRRSNSLDADTCKHGLLKGTCSWCSGRDAIGKLKTREYREAIADITLEVLPPPKIRKCEECPRRGANKGNRINVRLPRPRQSFAVGAKVYPPSWSGPIVTRPRVRPATHMHKGHWLCDKCDPQRAVGAAPASASVLTEEDIFL